MSPPDSDPFSDADFEKIWPARQADSPQTRTADQVPETPSTFHPRAQRNAFRRTDARLQSRSFARWNQLY